MTQRISKLYLPRKQQKLRTKIFRDRARKYIKPLAVEFYRSQGALPKKGIDKVVDSIVDDIVRLMNSEPEFLYEDQNPHIKTEDDLLDKLVDDVIEKCGESLDFGRLDDLERKSRQASG